MLGLIFLGLFLTSMAIWYVSNLADRRFVEQQKRLLAESALAQAEIWIGSFLIDYAQDLTIISRSETFRGAVAGRESMDVLSSDFQAWLIAKPDIAQLRYIDAAGEEVLRLDRIDNAVSTIGRDELQNKSDRYYFSASIQLPPDMLFMSPIDLNIEFGRIEDPWRPMIRMAMPIYQSGPEPAGILIVNLNAGHLLNEIQVLGTPVGEAVEILNAQGYWLGGAPRGDLWGFMFDNGRTLARSSPELWAAMADAPYASGVQQEQNAVFISLPLAQMIAENSTFEGVFTDEPRLYLLVRHRALAGFFSWANIPFYLALALTCALVAAFAARLICQRRAAEEKARAAEEQVVRLDRLAGLGTLVAGVAHELNTPIGNALMASTTVDHRVNSLDQAVREGRIGRNALSTMLADIRDGSAMMNGSLRRASEIIKSFKQFAIDQTSDRRRRFVLDTYLSETLHLLEPQFSKSGIRLQAGHIDAVRMESFPGPLGQVITNLLVNARVHAFSPGKKGTVTVSARATGDNHVAITVADDGKGIDPEKRDQIFVPFFSTAGEHGGSGLGLGIVNNIVVGVLGGTLSVESEPGQGTRITLLVPAVAPAGNGYARYDVGGKADAHG